MSPPPLSSALPVRRAMAEPDSNADKRDRILAAAEDLFFRLGFRGATLDMICAELGVTKPYVYYYFRDKQHIFETLAWRASFACLTAFRFPPEDTRPAHLRLAEGLHRFMQANIENFRSGTFAYREPSAFRAEFNDELRALANGFYDDLRALLDAGRNEGRLNFDDTTLTAFAIGSIAGFLYTWYRPEGRLPPEAMVAKMTAMLYKLVGLPLP